MDHHVTGGRFLRRDGPFTLMAFVGRSAIANGIYCKNRIPAPSLVFFTPGRICTLHRCTVG